MHGFQQLIDALIAREGGYSNDPNDSGGETNFGITIAVARAFGYKGSMKDMPREWAVRIYKARYWDSMLLDEVYAASPILAEEMFDTGVNLGVSRAGEFLQRSLNALNLQAKLYPDLTVDGRVGPMSVAALNAYLKKRRIDGARVLIRALNSLQGAFYIDLAERRQKDEAYVFGWLLNRVQ